MRGQPGLRELVPGQPGLHWEILSGKTKQQQKKNKEKENKKKKERQKKNNLRSKPMQELLSDGFQILRR